MFTKALEVSTQRGLFNLLTNIKGTKQMLGGVPEQRNAVGALSLRLSSSSFRSNEIHAMT